MHKQITKQYKTLKKKGYNRELSGILIFEKQRNISIRRERKVPTANSQLHVAKIGDI